MRTVLLIDDDIDDREIFSDTIGEIDPLIQCVSKSNCRKALDYLKSTPPDYPDCIFLDLNMPALNGLLCLERLKKLSAVQNIPIIIYTTSKNPQDRELTIAMGAADFLTKRSHLDELKRELSATLNKWAPEN